MDPITFALIDLAVCLALIGAFAWFRWRLAKKMRREEQHPCEHCGQTMQYEYDYDIFWCPDCARDSQQEQLKEYVENVTAFVKED